MKDKHINLIFLVGTIVCVFVVGYLIVLEVGASIQQYHEMYGDEPIHSLNDVLLPTPILHLVICGVVLCYVQYKCHKLTDGDDNND